MDKQRNDIVKNCAFCGDEFVIAQSTGSRKNVSKYRLYCGKLCRHRAAAIRYKGTLTLTLRFLVLRRDGFTCKYCGRNPKEDAVKLQVDHVYPKSKGGKDTLGNLITACADCNAGKNDLLIH